MNGQVLDQLWTAIVRTDSAIDAIQRKLQAEMLTCDVYLAYAAMTSSQFAGYLVTRRANIDRLIAFCPVSAELQVAGALWFRETRKQLMLAIQIARGPGLFQSSADAIWLEQTGDGSIEIPAWTYSLACIPLTFPWSGSYVYPRPFCPKLFETLAQRPEAAEWMRKRLGERVAS